VAVAAKIVMPRLSDSMDEGTIVRWLKASGEEVAAGQELVEIETDKATASYESEFAGRLTILAGEGERLPVGALMGRIGPDGAPSSGRANASPVARRLAERLGVDLGAIRGSGPSGRIVRRDVEAASDAHAEDGERRPELIADAAPAPEALKGESDVQAATGVQVTIARRMIEAKSAMPDFALTTEIDMDAVVRMRSELEQLEPEHLPSLNDFVVKACAIALRRHPRVNSSYRDGEFVTYGRVNIGIAVAAEGALLVPTVFDADTKSPSRIAAETHSLAARARAGELTPAELDGATFTVSNLGMFGITQFTAVLNPPQAAILAVGSLEERVVFRDGAAVPSLRMNVTLTCDHRILCGADAAAFLQSVRAGLEKPLGLLL
jgi:pyruvate dehydrogenase E2 component (dihydrolipoamide acetyltransferase)